MDLWIRSQDKEKLILAKGFEIKNTNFDSCRIFSVWENNYEMIGKYATKKRALEILDEIQKIVNGDDVVERLGNKGNMLNVFPNLFYQMPEE